MTAEPTLLSVRHPGGAYPVVVGAGLLSAWRELAARDGPAVVISDSHVAPLYAARCAPEADVLVMPAGEAHKTLDTVRDLYDGLLARGLERGGVIVALGGGVVGDVAGFVAATYLRGVAVVQAPTSLLAMVDASVGGKTGVDLPQGKNLVGAFKQPTAVVADVETLATLPPADFAGGLAEVVKHGYLSRPELLDELANPCWHPSAERQRSIDALQALVAAAIAVKQAVVEADPYEKGPRLKLNLGHTFAHALEVVSAYEIPHGQAVAMGLVAAAHLSARLGHAGAGLADEMARLLGHLGLPTRFPLGLPIPAIIAAMGYDKKKSGARLRFILLRDAGDVFIADDVPTRDVIATLRAMGAADE